MFVSPPQLTLSLPIQRLSHQEKRAGMKQGITPVSRERIMREEDFIVIQDGTPRAGLPMRTGIFMEFAGYRESELLGVNSTTSFDIRTCRGRCFKLDVGNPAGRVRNFRIREEHGQRRLFTGRLPM